MSLEWIVQNATFNTSSGNYFGTDVGTPSIVADQYGNSYITYYTTGQASGQTATGGQDVVVVKLSSSGTTYWVTQQPTFDTSVNDLNPTIAVDSSCNVYIAYQTLGTTSGQTHTSLNYDIAVAKLDTSGQVQWVCQQPSFNLLDNNTTPTIAVDPSGNLCLAYISTSGVVAVKMDSNGAIIWEQSSTSFSVVGVDTSPSIACDTMGNIYLAYSSSGVVSGQTTTGGTDIVVCKLNSSGQTLWVSQKSSFNTTLNDVSPSIAIDSNGYPYVAYQTNGVATYQTSGGNITYNPRYIYTTPDDQYNFVEIVPMGYAYAWALHNTGGSDIVLFKLNPWDGDTMWVTQTWFFNASSNNMNPQITIKNKYLYLAYQTDGVVLGQTNVGGSDIVIGMFDLNGLPLTVMQNPTFNTTLNDTVPTLTVDSSGNALVAYQTVGTIPGQTNTGGSDIVVFKMSNSPIDITFESFYGVIPLNGPITVGTTITYYYQFRNTGQIAITDGWVFANGQPMGLISILYPNETITGTYHAHVTGNDVITGQHVNQCEIYGYGSAYTAVDYASYTITFQTITIGWILQQPSFNTGSIETDPEITLDSSGFLYVAYACYSSGGGSDMTFYASYSSGINGDYGMGSLTGAQNGNVTIGSGKVTFGSQQGNWIQYSAIGNAQIVETGAVRFKYTPNYTGYPTFNAHFVGIGGGFHINQNQLEIWHSTTGYINVAVSDSTGYNTNYPSSITWVVTSGTEYEVEVDIDFNEATRIFINGIQLGNALHPYESRTTANMTLLQVSSSIWDLNYDWGGFSMRDLAIYNTVQHTSDYTPGGYAPPIDPMGVGDYDIAVMKMTNQGVVQWVSKQSTFNTTSLDRYPSIGHDQNGNTYVAYYTQGVTSGQTMTGSKGNVAVFKLDSSGLCQWVRQQPTFNSTADDVDPSVAVDASGNTYVTYCANGMSPPEQYEDPLLTITFSNPPYTSMSLVTGNSHWQSFVPLSNTSLESYGGYIDCSSGQFYYTLYRGQGSSGIVIDTSPIMGFFAGGYQWQITTSLAHAPLYLYQYYTLRVTCVSGTIDWAYTSYPQQIYPYGRSDFDIHSSLWFEIYTAQPIADLVTFKLDTDGNLLWMVEQPPLSGAGQFAPSMVIDTSGNSYIAFYTNGTTSGQTNTGGYDIAVIKLNSSGIFQWASQKTTFNTASDDGYPSLACDPLGNLYVAYQTNGVASGQTVTGSTDIVVFKLNSSGETQWVSQQPTFNAYGANTAPSIAFGSSGFVYVVYQTTGAVSGQASTGGIDVVYVVFDGSGNVHLATQATFNTTGDDTQPDLVVDTSGITYVVYKTNGQASGQTKTGLDDLVIFSVVPDLPIIGFVSYTYFMPPNPTVGTEITYFYDVQNLGNVSVTCSILDHSTTITLGVIPVGGNTTATSVYSLVQSDFDLGYVATQAVATTTYQVTTQASLTINLPQVRLMPFISDYYGEVVTPWIYIVVGDPIVYTYEVSNSGNMVLLSGVITDDVGTPALLVGNIPVGITTYTNSHRITQSELNQGSLTSQAIITGWFGAERQTSLPVTTSVTITRNLGISIDYQNGSAYFIPSGMVVLGTQIAISYSVYNDSSTPLTDCYVIDQNSQTRNIGTLEVFETGTITIPYTVTQGDIAAEGVTMTVTCGGFCGLIELTDNVTTTVTINIVCQMSLFYCGSVASYPVVYGSPVTYYICVQNTGNVPLVSTDVSDTLGYTTTITTAINTGQSHVVTHTYLVTSGDLVAGGIISSATASGSYPPIYVNASAQSSLSFSVSQPLSLGWLKQQPVFNTTGDDVTPSIAVDNSGNVYVAYTTNGVASGQTLTGGPDNIVVFKLQHQSMDQWEVQWITEQPSFNTNANNMTPSLVVDASGNSYVAYCGDGVASGQTNTGSYDIVVFKLDTDGQVLWVTQQPDFNTPLIDMAPAVALDISGNVHVTYMTTGTIPGGNMIQYNPGYWDQGYSIAGGLGSWQSFTIPFNGSITSYGFNCFAWFMGYLQVNLLIGQGSTGTLVDTNTVGSIHGWLMFTPSGGSCSVTSGQKYSIQVIKLPTASGLPTYPDNWIVSDDVYSGGTNNLDPSKTMTFAVQMVPSLTNYNVVGFELNNTGTLHWAKQLLAFNTPDNDLFPVTAVDTDGNTYIAYYTTGTTEGGSNIGGDDIVVFKLDTTGKTVWIQQQPVYNTTGDDIVPSIGIDSSGNVYIAYQTTGCASGQTLTGTYDIVLFKITGIDGQLLWITQQPTFNTTQSNIQPRLTIDVVGNVYVTFSTNGTGSGQTNLGGYDIVVIKFDTNGDFQWITQQPSFNTNVNDTNPVIAVDPFKNLYVTYQTTGTASNQTNLGGTDLVVFMLSPFDLALTINAYNGEVTDYANRIMTYTYQLTNTGTRVLNNVTIHDTLIGNVVIGDILPNQMVTKTEPYQLTPTNIVDGYVSNQMYVTATSITTAVTTITTNLPTTLVIPIQTWIKEYATIGDNTRPKNVYVQDLYVSYMTTGTASGQVMTGNPDLVLCKLDANGTQQWITQTGSFNTPRVNQLPSITGDSSGNVYLAYQTNGTMYPLVNLDGNENIIACQIKSDGFTQWLQQPNFQTTSGSMNTTPAVATDFNGNTYIAYESIPSGLSVIGVSKLNSQGQSLWINPNIWAVGQNCWTPSVAVDSSSNAYIAYSMETASSGSVIAVTKLNSSGLSSWVSPVFVSELVDYSLNPSITVDTSGNSYTIYQTQLRVNEWIITITSLDTNGLLRWTSQQESFNTYTLSTNPQITLDSSGNLYSCYSTDGSLILPYFYAYFGSTLIVFNLDTNGNFKWALQNVQSNTGFSVNELPSITTDNQGGIYTTYQRRLYNEYNNDNQVVEISNLTTTPASITLVSSGEVSSSGYHLYTYTIGNGGVGVGNLTSVTINDTLGASGLLGTLVPTGSVTITFVHATLSGTTSTATAIGLYTPVYFTTNQMGLYPPYYVSAQQTMTVGD